MQLNLLIIGPQRPDPDSTRTNVEGLSDFLEDQAGYMVVRGSELPELTNYQNILFLINPFVQLPYEEFKKVYSKNLFFYFSDCNEYQDIYKLLGEIANAIIVDDPIAVTFFSQFCINSYYIFHGLSDHWIKDESKHICEKDLAYSFVGRIDRGVRRSFFREYYETNQSDNENGITSYVSTNGLETLEAMFANYTRAKFVINFTGISTKNPLGVGSDRFPKMKKQMKGRIYEALACGANVITEDHPHIQIAFADLMQYIYITTKIDLRYLENNILSLYQPIPEKTLAEIRSRFSYQNTINEFEKVIYSGEKFRKKSHATMILAMRYRQAWTISQIRRVKSRELNRFKIGFRDVLASIPITFINSCKGHG